MQWHSPKLILRGQSSRSGGGEPEETSMSTRTRIRIVSHASNQERRARGRHAPKQDMREEEEQPARLPSGLPARLPSGLPSGLPGS